MKKLPIITAVLLATATLLCCKNTEEQETEPTTVILDTLVTEKSNALSGTVYREITEVPQLKEYEKQASGLINNEANGNYKYAISKYSNDKNFVVIFQELVDETDKPNPKYKILDTLNIPQIAIEEQVAVCTCRLNKTPDSEIIAIVKAHGSDDVEYYDHVIKAWRADSKTQKIIPIEDVKGIDCINEMYGH